MTNELQTQNFSQQTNNDLAIVEQSREIAQVQAQHIVAKKFPRDENVVLQKVIKQCQRKSMAEVAMYSYPRGGQNVTGPSIRLAELLANGFGNLEYGIRVLSQTNEIVEAMAYCIDLENNTRKVDYFTVKLEKYTKSTGNKKLTDPRDIYEHTQSQGARRVRGCILAIIPGDIVEAAVEQCEKTLNSDEEPIQVKIQKLITAFTSYNVSVEMIEKKMGKSINALNNPDILALRKIYQSLKDGMASIDQFFETASKQSVTMNVADLKNTKPEPDYQAAIKVTEDALNEMAEEVINDLRVSEPEIDKSEQIYNKHESAIKSYKNEKSLTAHFNYVSTKEDLQYLEMEAPLYLAKLNKLYAEELKKYGK